MANDTATAEALGAPSLDFSNVYNQAIAASSPYIDLTGITGEMYPG